MAVARRSNLNVVFQCAFQVVVGASSNGAVIGSWMDQRLKEIVHDVIEENGAWLMWTNSYFVATVGGAPLFVIKQYFEQGKQR